MPRRKNFLQITRLAAEMFINVLLFFTPAPPTPVDCGVVPVVGSRRSLIPALCNIFWWGVRQLNYLFDSVVGKVLPKIC